MYINLPDSDKGNLMIAYVTLDRKFPVSAFVAVSLFKEVSLSSFSVDKHSF